MRVIAVGAGAESGFDRRVALGARAVRELTAQ